MEYVRAVSRRFDASHQVQIPGCHALHGHTWTVTVRMNGRLEPTPDGIRIVNGDEDFGRSVELVVAELDGRHLNDMLPGVSSVPEGIAAWFLERLPIADEVIVSMGWRELTGIARRTRR